ncbi:pseudouridylate synthase 1 homolog [Branchiostoma floridae x Branchiostoma japonicum]
MIANTRPILQTFRGLRLLLCTVRTSAVGSRMEGTISGAEAKLDTGTEAAENHSEGHEDTAAMSSTDTPSNSNDVTTSGKFNKRHHDTKEPRSYRWKKAKLQSKPGGDPDWERPTAKKRKVACLLAYSGVGYMGMQRNQGFKTIEEDLLAAFYKAGAIPKDHMDCMQKMHFQRCARTDKGVSAAGQIVSMKMYMIEDAVQKINDCLAESIRLIGIKRTTNGFDSKNACDARTYMYVLPTYSFAPTKEETEQDFRATDDIMEKVNDVLSAYRGTHNFHNFTSGKKFKDPSAKRYIIESKCLDTFVRDDIEWTVISIKGQSFMIHQIRKMIGMMLAIVRGLAPRSMLERAWQEGKCDIPKAPGLGLVLDKVHFDHYNRKYGGDGLHEALEWDEHQETVEKFKEQYIYPTIIKAEKEDRVMQHWLSTLPLHRYKGLSEEETDNLPQHQDGETQQTAEVDTAEESSADTGDVPAKDEPSSSSEDTMQRAVDT